MSTHGDIRPAIRTAIGAWRGPAEFPYIPAQFCDELTDAVLSVVSPAESGRLLGARLRAMDFQAQKDEPQVASTGEPEL